ncbi:exo-poly-alpha-D-galacturonosidase [Petrotoga sp. 9T1HF07.CasAA.8.2]|uniref:glycoside hydrolase family 28 protein n=1 Tax=Petrotoga sp. 9T1HF07.CasAA.8.2 TaxID=1434329 RepID=UPI000CC6A145|nr:glycoside hydrolase family 28 protein [Petrotoga sp. 9T1HF07.CasAA.8.2]PNR88183.1 exo-poly-alpha-D-galacturonosidase [Petrotoga sp. 9T1HF07.CasAA.8.2]
MIYALSSSKEVVSAVDTQDDWNIASKIIQSVQRPQIPERDFVITDFGAVNDGVSDARPAIIKAIDAASDNGGGRVVIPAGEWYCKGPIHLKSNIELHVAEGAYLLFSPYAKDYLPVVLTKYEGTRLYNYSPLIYARNVHDVAITGKGVIDGNKDSEFLCFLDKHDSDVALLRQMGAEGVPVEERIFGEGHFLRPCMIQFYDAERVLLKDYTVVNSPFWVNHLNYTNHAFVRGINVDTHNANNDGINIESSSYVVVEKSKFQTGDDSVVVKSGRDYDGRQVGIPSENIVVYQNDMGGEDGVALGSEMSGGIRNVFFTDNILRNGASAFRFKSNLDRGGVVENIRVRNMEIDTFERLFWFQMNYPGELGGYYPSIYKNIVFENITVKNVDTVFEAHAPKGFPLQDVVLKNIIIENVESDNPIILENVKNIRFENVKLNDQYINATIDWY